MCEVTFYCSSSNLTGFCVSGHSGFATSGSDIVCAAVSSATIMCANTVTEVLGLEADITESDGYLRVFLPVPERAQSVLRGLELHLKELAKVYPSNISIKYGGNGND